MNTGICPMCKGTGKTCINCGGQTMLGNATGRVRLRPDGVPCTHEFTAEKRGRCYYVYTCKHCQQSYEIDSGG
jgi:hypothetical protein